MKKLSNLLPAMTILGLCLNVLSPANATTNATTNTTKASQPSYMLGSPLTVNVDLLGLKGNKAIGTVTVFQSPYGVVFQPHLRDLPPGIHGFHVHAGTSCDPAYKDGKLVLGLAAKGHYDPDNTGRHSYVFDPNGHRGDLPVLYVDQNGVADQPVLSPRLTLKEIQGLALMIHAGGDNHSDYPAKLGGGGARLACGVIPRAK